MNVEDIALKLQETTDRSVRNEGRIKKLEENHGVLQNLATSVAVLAEQIKTMNETVSSLNTKVEHLEAKPAKRWDGVVDKIISTVVALLIGFLLAKLGI